MSDHASEATPDDPRLDALFGDVIAWEDGEGIDVDIAPLRESFCQLCAEYAGRNDLVRLDDLLLLMSSPGDSASPSLPSRSERRFLNREVIDRLGAIVSDLL